MFSDMGPSFIIRAVPVDLMLTTQPNLRQATPQLCSDTDSSFTATNHLVHWQRIPKTIVSNISSTLIRRIASHGLKSRKVHYPAETHFFPFLFPIMDQPTACVNNGAMMIVYRIPSQPISKAEMLGSGLSRLNPPFLLFLSLFFLVSW